VDYFRKFWRKVDESIKKGRRRELLRLERESRLTGEPVAPASMFTGDDL
jgi:hypothetical protein